MRKSKYLIPNDFRDFLSILSFIGFIAIFLSFTFENSWLNDNMTSFFLIIGGSAFLVIGKVFNIKYWARDGIQQNEVSLVIASVFGISAIILGLFLLFQLNIQSNLLGYIGILALVPAIYILIDYVAKNK
jgi:glucose-6-phosphate-specific signal transduction histidine kinase